MYNKANSVDAKSSTADLRRYSVDVTKDKYKHLTWNAIQKEDFIMIEFIQNLSERRFVTINSNKYKISAKSIYVTESNPVDWYAKIFFEDHHVLVMSPADDFIYFGKDVGSIGIEEPFGEIISYRGKKYVKVAEDYQIVKKLEFGSPITTEGEVKFGDYECESDNKDILSLGTITRTRKRADIVARVIRLSDITLS